jgi:hypothetical protein
VDPLPAEASRFLDFPESERSDVLRGLRTYVASGAKNTRTFEDLDSRLSPDKQVPEPDVVKELAAVMTPR